jgi:hypothetical protein
MSLESLYLLVLAIRAKYLAVKSLQCEQIENLIEFAHHLVAQIY